MFGVDVIALGCGDGCVQHQHAGHQVLPWGNVKCLWPSVACFVRL